MKLTVVLPTLLMALKAVADTNAGPYTTDFNKYCSFDQQGGTIDIDGTKWSYECHKGVRTDPNDAFRSRTAFDCADWCNDEPDCKVAVWHSKDGKCWNGKPSGTVNPVQGSMIIRRPSELDICQADLDKYKPVEPLWCMSQCKSNCDYVVWDSGSHKCWYTSGDYLLDNSIRSHNGNHLAFKIGHL